MLRNFWLRVSLAKTRTYFVMTRVYGKLVRLTIGKAKLTDDDIGLSLKEAREKVGELVELAGRGIDPRQLKKQERDANAELAQNTFKAIGERFMKQYAMPRLAASTLREYRRVLFGPDTERWAKRPVSFITRADVRFLLDAMIERGSPSAANNVLAYLSKFFNWCAEKDLIELPPTDRMRKPSPKVVGERTLSESEIVEVWRAFEAEGDAFRDLFKLLLLTGQRRAEVGEMRFAELSGMGSDKPIWEIPSHRTKNGRPHIVPLSPLACSIIESRPHFGDLGFLFTTTGKTPLSGFSKAKGRLDEWLANHRKEKGIAPMPEWTLHDLRRTVVTMMNERLGIAPHIVEACVNHISGSAKAGVAGVYNKAVYLRTARGLHCVGKLSAKVGWRKD
jgi:integrase